MKIDLNYNFLEKSIDSHTMGDSKVILSSEMYETMEVRNVKNR